jgi:hypothetical protein
MITPSTDFRKAVDSMRKFIPHSDMVTDGCLSMDPINEEIIQGVYKRTIRDGEERLMFAVLENAVEYFQKYVLARKPSGKQLFREAEEWFLDKESEALYSFENICDTLGFHPDHIRKGLMAWKEARIKMSSVQSHAASRSKLANSRVNHSSIRLSKTA